MPLARFSVSNLRTLIAGVLMLLLALLPASARAGILNSQEQAIADKLAGSNRPFVVVDPILTKVARQRAADMANRHYFAHVNPDGNGPNYLVEAAGYKLPDYWGDSRTANNVESIAAGATNANDTWNDWMGSSAHKTHLMAENDFYKLQTSIGVGVYSDPDSDYGTYWVVITAPPQPIASLTITAPATNGVTVTTSQIGLAGKTGTAVPASSVVYRVENAEGTSAFQAANGVTTWSAVATGLIPGNNTIRIRSLTATGTLLKEATRTVLYKVMKPLTVSVQGQGTLTAGFLGTTERALGLPVTINAIPASGWMFAGWSGSATSSVARSTFTMAEGMNLVAKFIPNPFMERRGRYEGLLSGAPGSLILNMVSTGQFTVRVNLKGASYSGSGRFDVNGRATVKLNSTLSLNLALDVNGHGGVTGSLSGAATASLTGGKSYRVADSGDYPHAGRYTVLLPHDPSATGNSALPQGDGSLVLLIDKTGRARYAGYLADGSAVSGATTVTNDGKLALYLPLYTGKGYLSGSATVRSTSVSDLDGQVQWMRPANSAAKFFPAGFTSTLGVVGSGYQPPASGQPFLAGVTAPEGSLTLAAGNLAEPLVGAVGLTVTTGPAPVRQPLSGLKVTYVARNGTFSGSFTHPVSGKTSTFRGMVLQKQNAGFGFFQGVDAFGSAVLEPAN